VSASLLATGKIHSSSLSLQAFYDWRKLMKKASFVLIAFVTIVGLLIFARGETSA